MPDYPPELALTPWSQPQKPVRVRVPGSKSLTNRALAIAALAHGTSTLTGALDSEDTRVMVEALRALGLTVEHDPDAATIKVQGCAAKIPATQADLNLANSGTSLRFLTALVSTGKGHYRLDGSPRMRQRPVDDLLAALNRLGAIAKSELGTGCPPVTIDADGLHGGHADVRGDISSQFLSGLLMALPAAKDMTAIEVQGTLVSKPYVEMTLKVMEAFAVRVENRKFRRFLVGPGRYVAREYAVEPDASAASYFFALAAVTGGTVTVEGLGTDSIQGDMAFVDILEHMGCTVTRQEDETTVTGGPLRGVDVDMNAISDTVMTLAALAVFADGPTRIRNVAHIRHKETDRIAALANELRKVGATVDEYPDGLILYPPDHVGPARIETYNDHRMAMSFALLGTRAEGIVILDPKCVEKTYPNFWIDLDTARAGMT